MYFFKIDILLLKFNILHNLFILGRKSITDITKAKRINLKNKLLYEILTQWNFFFKQRFRIRNISNL